MDNRRSTARTRHTGIRVAALLITLLISVPGFGAAQVAGASFMVSHPVPWSPLNLTLEDDGVIWMTFPAEDLVGRLTVNPNGDDFTAFTPPTANSEPYDLVYHDGTVWFTLKAGNRLARLDTNDLESGISEFVLPTAASEPTGLAIGRDGRVWVLAQGTNKLVVFDPDTSTFDEVDMPESVHDAGAEKITTRGDNTVWFAVPPALLATSWKVPAVLIERLKVPAESTAVLLLLTCGKPGTAAPLKLRASPLTSVTSHVTVTVVGPDTTVGLTVNSAL